MSGFERLKLGADLIEHLARLGVREPSALQSEAVPAIARGTSVVGVASSGSGKTLAIGLGLSECLAADRTGPQALALRPTDAAAAATAEVWHGLLGVRGLDVALIRPNCRFDGRVAVASPAAALAAVERSAIKLDSLRTIVIDGVSSMIELGAAEALETLIAQAPKEAQRVVLSSASDERVENFTDRHARRARQLLYLPAEPDPLPGATAELWVGAAQLWLPLLTRYLENAQPALNRWIIRCRREDEVRSLASQLTVRGFPAQPEVASAPILVEWDHAGAGLEPGSASLSWGPPLDVEGLRRRVEGSVRALFLIEPRELAHLQRLAAATDLRLAALRSPLPEETLRSAQHTRSDIRDAISERDLEPYLLLLEPLLLEFTPIELAAAATALLRERRPPPSDQLLPAWTRLYFGVGRRDGVRPADLVGAITGESSIAGDRIGRIEIRDTHSSVEVAASVADRVIKSLASATIRGRPANVRVFRE